MIQLQIEPTNQCQAACVFCLHPKMRRTKGVMPQELFERIVDQACEVPLIDHLTITGLGEPLLDKGLPQKIKYAAKKLKGQIKRFDLYTNGALLSDEIVKIIRGRLTELYVSLNATGPEHRREIMGLDDYERVSTELRRIIPTMDGTKLIVKAVTGKDLFECGDHELFINQWGGNWENASGHAFMHLEGNWAGETWKPRILQKRACFRALFQIMVLWDGRVSMCCFDGEGKEILGDLNTQTLKEVFNSGRATQLRKWHYEGERQNIPICKNCTNI